MIPLQEVAAWGASGHSIVAEIAQRRLEAGVAGKLRDLLGGNVSLGSLASWADDETHAHPSVSKSRWHYVDIPRDAMSYDAARDCKETTDGDCIIAAIARFRAALKDRTLANDKRVEALMYLVHFLGDLHQPMHCAEHNDDQGGNFVFVSFFGQPTSLHALWDTGLIDHTVFNWGAYVRRLDTDWFPGKDVAALQRGEPADWANEAHKAAVEVPYALPVRSHSLSGDYYQKALVVHDRQLASAGVRLARILNEALRD